MSDLRAVDKISKKKCPHSELVASDSIRDSITNRVTVLGYRCVDCAKYFATKDVPQLRNIDEFEKLYLIRDEL